MKRFTQTAIYVPTFFHADAGILYLFLVPTNGI